MEEKLFTILTEEEMKRFKFEKGRITVDLHHLTVRKARRIVNNLIALSGDGGIITLIHGYNNGTAIKDMIRREIINSRIIDKEVRRNNPGITDIKLAAV